jgi:hypothetical protein
MSVCEKMIKKEGREHTLRELASPAVDGLPIAGHGEWQEGEECQQQTTVTDAAAVLVCLLVV